LFQNFDAKINPNIELSTAATNLLAYLNVNFKTRNINNLTAKQYVATVKPYFDNMNLERITAQVNNIQQIFSNRSSGQQNLANGGPGSVLNVLDCRYSSTTLSTTTFNEITNSSTLLNDRLAFTNAFNSKLQVGSAGRNGIQGNFAALRTFTFSGYDQIATDRENAPCTPAVRITDQYPRVFFQQSPNMPPANTLVTKIEQNINNNPSIVFIIEGFNNGDGEDGDEQLNNIHINTDHGRENGLESPWHLFNDYWPKMQSILRSENVTGPNDIIVHVWWSGTIDKHILIGSDYTNSIAWGNLMAGTPEYYPPGAYFNVDMATAHFTGRYVLGPIIQQIQMALQMSSQMQGKTLPITIIAESCGNRVALSTLEYIREIDAQNNFSQNGLFPLRYVMIHPSLRAIDMTPDWSINYPNEAIVNDQQLTIQYPTHPYPESPMLTELGSLQSNDPSQCRIAMFSSSYDKAGLAFLAAQAKNPHIEPGSPEVLNTSMLGRTGLPVAMNPGTGLLGIRNPYAYSYIPGFSWPSISSWQVQTDYWHVDLWGWVLPNEPHLSRFIFDRNVSPRTEGNIDVAIGRPIADARATAAYVETCPLLQIVIPQTDIDAAWQQPALLTHQGYIGPSLNLEIQTLPSP
jgi:hypothetical protein